MVFYGWVVYLIGVIKMGGLMVLVLVFVSVIVVFLFGE